MLSGEDLTFCRSVFLPWQQLTRKFINILRGTKREGAKNVRSIFPAFALLKNMLHHRKVLHEISPQFHFSKKITTITRRRRK